MARRAGWLALLLSVVGLVTPASAQTTTYHLHAEPSSTLGLLQLKTAGPDVTSVTVLSGDLKGMSPHSSGMRTFDTQAGVPGVAGIIPSGSTVTATFWMRKTSAFGVVLPKAWFGFNWSGGGFSLCNATGTTSNPDQRLTTTITAYTFSCQTTSAITVTATDRLYVQAGYDMTTGPGNKSMKVELRYEGTTGGNYDSLIIAPNAVPPTPTITNLDPASGPVNWSVTVTGTNFGATQGSSTIKFNGTTATPTGWGSTSISAPVPAGATSGNVVVTVNSTASNGVAFNVIPPPTLSTLTPPTAHISDAVTITGNNFLSSQGSSTVKFNGTTATPTNWSNTSITAPVPAGATSGNVVVTVSSQASNGLPFTLIPPPTVKLVTPTSGQIGTAVTVVGTTFGATQGSNTVKFNGTTAAPTSWSDTSISTTVPAGATTGNVVVTVSNQASNSVAFTVLVPGTIGGTITRVTGGTAISGASVQAVLAGVVQGSATTAGNGTYSIPGLDPTSYDVRVSATGFSSELRQGVAVTSSTSTTLDVAMYVPGSASGKVTQADGTTPIVGAAVSVYAGPIPQGSTNTNGTGDYVISNLHPGTYTVQAANVSHQTEEQSAVINESAATTTNFSLDAAPVGSVLYAYDDLGRLVQVTDPSGASAIYRYDAVGNIVAIERPGSMAVAISGFTPVTGAVGATVTIFGSGFNITPGSNTVTLNGAAATVTSATATEIVTTVPAGATTGPIAVTNTGTSGSATTSTNFTVASAGTPTITSFTPPAAASPTALEIDGTNFDPAAGNNAAKLNATFLSLASATATHLSTTVPPTATSGRIRVSTALGTGTSATDFWVPPTPYTPAHLEFKARMNGFGDANSVQATIGTAGNVGLVLFDGVPGQKVTVKMTGGTTGNTPVSVIAPNNVTIGDTITIGGTGFIDVLTLATTGSYTVFLDPPSTSTGNLTVTVYDVPADVTGTITPGGAAVPVTIPIPGQKAAITFAATAGQRVSLDMTGGIGGLGDCTAVTIKKPDGSIQASQSCVTTTGAFIDRQDLTAGGTYTIALDPVGRATGTMTLTLYDVPADVTGSVTINGAALPITIAAPGQNANVTFAGSLSQGVAVPVTLPSGFPPRCAAITLLRQDDMTVVATTSGCGTSLTLPASGTIALPATETYHVLLDPSGSVTGNFTVGVTSP